MRTAEALGVLRKRDGDIPYKQHALRNSLLVVIVSIVTASMLFFALAKIIGIAIAWYMVAAAVALGILETYGAIFGYDNLIAIIITAGQVGVHGKHTSSMILAG